MGAKVAATGGGDSMAFKKPDGSIVAVPYNSGAAMTMTVTISGKKLQLAMPGNGRVTLLTTRGAALAAAEVPPRA